MSIQNLTDSRGMWRHGDMCCLCEKKICYPHGYLNETDPLIKCGVGCNDYINKKPCINKELAKLMYVPMAAEEE